MTPRAAVIGLDGAAWQLLDPLMESDAMPRLSALRERGVWGSLESTVPVYTPPAWTSALTGVNPGRHGIFGFNEGHAQRDRRELSHCGKVKAATLWEMTKAQGARAGIYNVPLTYPPQQVDGWMVSGMMTPGYGERVRGFAQPRALEERILDKVPGYVIDLNTNYEQDWRDDSLCRRALESIEQRRVVLEELLELDPPDVVFSVLEAPDRLQHVYYRYMNPSDELYESKEARALRPAIAQCFAALDEIVGVLVDWAGSSGGVLVCSDHGFTAWKVSVHTNALLEKWGYLKLKPGARVMQTRAARDLVPLAKRFLPRRLSRQAKSRTFGAIDWSRTRAFASFVPQQGIHVNLAGREPFGIVSPDELEAVKDDLVRRFAELTGPDGRGVTDEVFRREEVLDGEALEGAPDLFPVLRDHTFELDDELFHREPFTDCSRLPRGVHHPDGIVLLAGAGVAGGSKVNGSIVDVAPTLLYLAGLRVPDGLDGRVLTEAFEPEHLRARPVEGAPQLSSQPRDESSPYSEEEEAMIEESLRGLGYL